MADDKTAEFVISSSESIPVGIVFSVAVFLGFLFVIFNCVKKQDKAWKEDSIYGQGVDRVDYRRPKGGIKNSHEEKTTPVTEDSIYGQGVVMKNENKGNSDGHVKNKDRYVPEESIYGEGVAFQNAFKKEHKPNSAQKEKNIDVVIPTVHIDEADSSIPNESNHNYTQLERTQVGSAMYAMIIKPSEAKQGAAARSHVTEQRHQPKDMISDGKGNDSSSLEAEDDYSVIKDGKIPPQRVPPSRPPPVLEKASDTNEGATYSKNNNAGHDGAKTVYEVVEPAPAGNNKAAQGGRAKTVYEVVEHTSDKTKNVHNRRLRDNINEDVEDSYSQNFRISNQTRSHSEPYAQVTLTTANDRRFSSPYAIVEEDDYGCLSSEPIAPASPDGVYDMLKHRANPHT